jgi:hypothetical protein
MNETRMDGLLRRLDVDARPDPLYLDHSLEMLLPFARRARRVNATLVGRLWLGLREGLRPLTDGTWTASRTGRLTILLAILLVAALAIAVVGALRNDRPAGHRWGRRNPRPGHGER